ncbi:MAG: hypothetical protein Q9181_006900, partial [Wetmoreana brouardii]
VEKQEILTMSQKNKIEGNLVEGTVEIKNNNDENENLGSLRLERTSSKKLPNELGWPKDGRKEKAVMLTKVNAKKSAPGVLFLRQARIGMLVRSRNTTSGFHKAHNHFFHLLNHRQLDQTHFDWFGCSHLRDIGSITATNGFQYRHTQPCPTCSKISMLRLGN